VQRVLTRPEGLRDEHLAAALAAEWGVVPDRLVYRPVGFGSHHWEAEAGGRRWFLTVDEIRSAAQRDLLAGALGAARRLRDRGRTFAVAPLPTLSGQVLAELGPGFALALYPFVDGQTFDWGEWAGPVHRRAVLDVLVVLHGEQVGAPKDDLALPDRPKLESSLRMDAGWAGGPFAARSARLVAQHADALQAQLRRFDEMVATCGPGGDRWVLTHGEPHPGNTLQTAAGWVLVDWDTARLAPPERDLWLVDDGDGAVLDAYAAATGWRPRRELLELFTLRWDLADVGGALGRLRAPHSGSAHDAASWRVLRDVVIRLAENA
jgi:spectinomycin phosphotransferase/16S rRNA (guanine(1405)-N(7))-methyltransferase